ncbi:MAG: pyrimidine 5'-nucleotidase [Anaerolineales bacterium]|nr:pyrimidine 5'-nucleotidase [Anaerolineales bacterium]
MNFDVIFFDLDATLYPGSNGLWPAIGARIDRYMYERLGFDRAQISELRHHYYLQHGTTLCGLQKFHQVDAKDYLDFVHDLPLTDYLQPDPALRAMLLSLPARRWVFTNSDAPHAKRVLRRLGIEDCFEGMIDIFALAPACKPHPEAYQLALQMTGQPIPGRCALLDDSPRNLETAKELGIFTVLVGSNGTHPVADRNLVDIHDLRVAVPEFWGLM